LQSVYQFVQNFQGMIVGLIGFTGVIVTLLVNARIARIQHDRQISHQATVVRNLIRVDLRKMRDIFKDRIQRMGDPGTGFYFPINPMTGLYEKLGERMGLLSEGELLPVLETYALLEELPQRAKFLEVRAPPDAPTEMQKEGQIYIPAKAAPVLAKMHENFLVKIESALAVLKA
jgi:hypothetical protein